MLSEEVGLQEFRERSVGHSTIVERHMKRVWIVLSVVEALLATILQRPEGPSCDISLCKNIQVDGSRSTKHFVG